MDESFLPVEILELIFYFCVPWLRVESATRSPCIYSSSRRPPHPLAFTEVCRRWTWAARTSSRLWSVIDLSNTPLTQHCINYTSGDLAPLHIVSGAAANKITLSHIEETCTSLSRSPMRLTISTIDVSLYPIVLSSLFSSLTGPLHSDFALLTKLVLRVPPMTMFNPVAINVNVNVNVDAVIHDTSSGPISLSISSLPIPSVRHLELDGVPVHWTSVQSLEHLSLRGLIPDELASPTLRDLQGILTRSKETLQFCRLENILFPIDDCDFAMEVEPIYLQRLHTLSISAAPHVTSSILHSIKVPASTHVQLYTLLRGDLHSVLPPWFQIGAQSVRGGADVTSLRLCRHSAAFLRPNVQARSGKRTVRNRYYPDTSSDWDSGDAVFSVSSASSVPVPMAILDSVSYPSSLGLYGHNVRRSGTGIYDLRHLASLTLGVGALIDIPTSSLHTFLAYGAVNLEELRVGYQCDLSGLLGGLVASPGRRFNGNTKEGEMEAKEAQLGPCPRLRLLAFNRPSDRWWNFAPMWLDSVVDTVVSRSRLSPGQLRLEFWRCHGVTDVGVCGSFEKFGATIGEVGEVAVMD